MEFLEYVGQDYALDPTNTSLDPLRNRVRHQLLPLLRDDFQPQIVRSLQRLASLCN